MKENKLIAEFMGYENVGTLNNPMYDYYDNIFQDGSYEVKDLCYHKSWDWLMPVIEEINGQMHFNTRGLWRMITIPYDYHIEDVHNQVVEFINEYNRTDGSNETN